MTARILFKRNMFYISIFLLCVEVFGDKLSNIKDNLVAVVQIFRHGERVPVTFYKNDPYGDLGHWNGIKKLHLTPAGHVELYPLGLYTRNRYYDFLPQQFDKDFFHIIMTPNARCNISAQAFLYGLFPTSGYNIFETELQWLPIPIHEIDERILSPAPFTCSNYFNFLGIVLRRKPFSTINYKYRNVYEYLANFTGDAKNNMMTAFLLFQCLDIEKEVGFQLPKWTEEVYPEPLQMLAAKFLESFTYTNRLKRLYTGPLLKQIVEFLNDKAGNNTFSQKYIIYSAEDTNLAALLNTFGAFNPPFLPDFASSMWIELRETLGKYYVNVWFKNKDELKPMTIKGCDFNCSLDNFNALVKDVIIDVDTWDRECSNQKKFKYNFVRGG